MAEYNGLDAFEKGFLAAVADAEADFLQEVATYAKETWKQKAHSKLQATADYYSGSVTAEASDDAVTITVPKGLASAVDAGTNAFNLKAGFINPKTKTMKLERAPGDIRWRMLPGFKKMIPLDGGWPEKAKGNNWNHPGIKPRNITPEALDQLHKTSIELLLQKFAAKVTV